MQQRSSNAIRALGQGIVDEHHKRTPRADHDLRRSTAVVVDPIVAVMRCWVRPVRTMHIPPGTHVRKSRLAQISFGKHD